MEFHRLFPQKILIRAPALSHSAHIGFQQKDVHFRLPVSGISLSRPDFLHSFPCVVKSTEREKVGNPAKAVEAFYVNRKCISTPFPTCGKLLWTTLWRMWKTASYQQVFRLFPNPASPVEKSAYPFAYPSQRCQNFRVTSPPFPGLNLSKAFEKVYKL